jgi:hypothetical protein
MPAAGRYSSHLVTMTVDAPEIARLHARVAGLEAALERRSRELRLIQQHVCSRDLIVVSRVCAGLPLAKGAYDPSLWIETTAVTEADTRGPLGRGDPGFGRRRPSLLIAPCPCPPPP